MFFKKKKKAEIDAAETQARAAAAREKAYNDLLDSLPFCVEINTGAKIKRNKSTSMPVLTMSNITTRTNVEKLFPIVAIDTETTGLKSSDRIVEVGAVKFERGFVPVAKFSTLINPGRPIPLDAYAVNHISDDMVSTAPTFGEIAGSLAEFINGCTLVGHNLPFDLKMLFCSGLNLPEKVKYFDTLAISKKIFKKDEDGAPDHSLDGLCYVYNIYRPVSHRALNDALAAGQLFDWLIAEKV